MLLLLSNKIFEFHVIIYTYGLSYTDNVFNIHKHNLESIKQSILYNPKREKTYDSTTKECLSRLLHSGGSFSTLPSD